MPEMIDDPEALRLELESMRQQLQVLQSENALLRDVFNRNTDYFCRYTTDLIITFANDAYCARLGKTAQEVVGKSVLEFLNPEQQELAIEQISEISPEKPRYTSIQESTGADGQTIWIEWTDIALLNENGQIIGFQGIGRNVTEQQQTREDLRQSKERFSRVFDLLPVPVGIVSLKNSLILDVNEAFSQSIGYTKAEITGKTATQVGFIREAFFHLMFPNMNRDGVVWDFEWKYYHRSGEERMCSMSAALIDLDGQACVLIISQDITEKKQVQQQEMAMSRYLRAVVMAADELIVIEDDRTFERRAVEMMREHLGAERSSLMFFDEPAQIMTGTYGTDPYGNTIDESQLKLPAAPLIEGIRESNDPWFLVDDANLTHWDGQEFRSIRHGWLAITPVYSGGKAIGTLFTDSAIHGTPFDPIRQEAIAIYASLLGNIIQRRNTQKALLAADQRYRVLVESSQSVIAMISVDGTMIYMNDLAMRSYQFLQPDPVGKNISDLYPPSGAQRIMSRVQQVISSGAALNFESPGTIDGQPRYFRTTMHPVRDEQNTIYAVMVNAFDITAIHETQQALRDSEERYRRIVETANEGIWLSDKEGHAIYVNERMSEMLGYTVEEIIGSSILRFIDPDLQQEAEKKLRARVNGSNDTYDFLLRTKDESELWTSISATPFYDENGNINSVLAMVTDITQRKFVEETLQVANDLLEARVQERTEQLERERNLLRTLIDSMPDLIYAKDLQHRFVLSNRANALALGCEHPEDLIGKTDADYYPEEIATQFRRGEEGIFSTGKALLNLEHSAFSFNGGFEWGFTNKVPLRNPDGDLVGLVGITHDITERRQTQAILEQKYQEEQRFQQHLRSLHQITVELTEIDDLEALYRKAVEFALNRLSFDRFALFLYDAAAEMAIGTFGTDTAGRITDERDVRFKIENTGKFYQALVNPSHFYLAEDTNLLDGYSQPVGKGWNAVVALSHSDEHLGWITADNLLTGQAANYLQLELLAQYGVLIASILARKRAELTLRDSEARFRQLIDTMGGGVTMYDLGGRLIYVNDRMCQITGYKREELLEQSFLQVVDRVMAKELEEAIEQRDPLLPVQTGAYEVGLTRRDQRKLTLLVNGSPMYDGSGRLTGSFAVLVDITRQKEAEETLRRSLEREQELGRLKTQFVSTTSHEFRTPLAIILATTETIMRFHDRLEPEQLVNRLEKIRGQVYHLRQIMDDVLHLAKMQAGRTDFKPRTANLHALLEEIVEGLNNSSEHTDRIHYQSDEQVINMAFDPRLMRQIMVNLISNALKYSSEDKFVDLHLGRENQHIVIHIQDHGIGIPADSMEHIFEPFHRASNVDTISGTGLGLAIVKEAVELHGGTITIDSVVNEGTLVTVRLPTNLVPIAEKDTTRRN